MTPFFNSEEKSNALESEAASWLGTPFQPNSCVRGHAVCCHMLCSEIYRALGVLGRDEPVPQGRPDHARFHQFSVMEEWLDAHPTFAKVGNPSLGDLIGFGDRRGAINHLGIVLSNNRVIHALRHGGAQLCNLDDATWGSRIKRVWRPVVYELESEEI